MSCSQHSSLPMAHYICRLLYVQPQTFGLGDIRAVDLLVSQCHHISAVVRQLNLADRFLVLQAVELLPFALCLAVAYEAVVSSSRIDSLCIVSYCHRDAEILMLSQSPIFI